MNYALPRGMGLKQCERYARAMRRSKHSEPPPDWRLGAKWIDRDGRVNQWPLVFEWRLVGDVRTPVVTL